MLPDYLTYTNQIKQTFSTRLKTTDYKNLSVLVDENTKEHCLPVILPALPKSFNLIEIKSGEINKTLDTCSIVWAALTEAGVDRHGLLINLGGGMICDLGGFCASIYKRGIDFWHIPTTLLAQVDATLGGKLGVDYGKIKNHIGLFRLPNHVIIDPVFLSTLPSPEILSGFAEIIKHAIISSINFLDSLQNEVIGSNNWEHVISRSLEIKETIVQQDPEENGQRKLLNFGHTVGHALESYFLDSKNPLKHGEAVAAGMIAESYISYLKTGLEETELSRISGFICSIYKFQKIEKKDYALIINLMKQDKKNKEGIIQSVLLQSIGSAVYDIAINDQEIMSGLDYLNNQIR